MLQRVVESHAAFRLILVLPAIFMAWTFFFDLRSWGYLLDQSGEWAFRLLALTLAITPLRLLMRQVGMSPHWPMWLFKRRRDMGLATFLYAALHLGVYLIRQSNLNVVLFDMQFREFMLGWLAFANLFALALTSNDASVHRLGRWWKPLQRLAYVSALAAVLHWYWIRLDHRMLWATVLPLLALEAYRLFHDFSRPAGAKH